MSIDSKPTLAPAPSPAQGRKSSTSADVASAPLRRAHPILRSLNRTSGLIGLSLRRLRHQLGLTLLALIGIVLAVGLVTSAGFFAQAVDLVVMRQELAEYTRITGRPPFSARVFTVHSETVPLNLARAEDLGRSVAETLSSAVGLPVRDLALQINSDIVSLVSPNAQPGSSGRNTNLIYVEGIAPHMTILDGAPFDADGTSTDGLDVWIYVDWADSTGMQVGETHTLQVGANQLPIRVAGIWQAANADDPFWISDPTSALADKLIIRRGDYLASVEPLLAVPVRSVTWRVVLDESQARPSEGRQYVSGFERANLLINRFLPGARLTTPTLPLGNFVDRQTTLTTLLLGFNVPGLGFLLYFLVLTSAVIAYWQRREIAIMVSRGMGKLTVLNFTLVEALILFAVGLPLGVGFGMLLARLMGYTASFLSFLSRDPLPVSLDGFNWRLIALTLGIVLAARLWAAMLASRQSVATQAREHSRPQQGPFWYRFYLDLLLVVPTVYAYDQLAAQGSLGMLVRDRPEDLYKDPLLILVPALFIVSLSLIAMRPFPWAMRLLDWIANRSPWLPLHLALRQLGRQSHTYINPLLLVIVSLALGVYTFSMAASLDQWLVDRVYYSAGADVTFEPYSEVLALTAGAAGAEWIPPADEYAAVPGVAAATRVGDYTAEIRLPNSRLRGRFLAIDRTGFASAAWFRPDFSAESMGALMNRLASSSDAVLVSRRFLEENVLQIGDQLSILVITDAGVSLTSNFTVAGVYDYFPTVYDDQVTIVGNLEFLFSFFGVTMPHNIWLKLQPGVDSEQVLAAVPTATGVDTIRELDVPATVLLEQAQMERVGVFGTLTVSFLMSALMAALGLLTYSYASLHERLFQFSVLRAVGMPRRVLLVQVLLEYATLTAYGAIAGVLIGSFAAELFVPLFRVAGDSPMPLPPLLPVVAHNEILPLVIGFAASMIVLELVVLSSALYQRIFVALRMGNQA